MKLPLIIALLCSGLLFCGCEKKSDSLTMDDVHESMKDFGDKAQDKAEDLGDATQDSYENYKDAVQN